MFEYVGCNLCGSDTYDTLLPSTLSESDVLSPDDLACSNLGHGDYHRIVCCRKCGLIYSNPRDPVDLIEDFYSKVRDDKYREFSEGRIATFRKAFNHLKELKRGKDLLDIGCYTGLFMKIAISRGWNAVGIEPSLWACEIGRRDYNLKIINTSIHNSGGIKDKFDVITLWDVIEHLADPKAVLKICRDKLKDNGIIAISTMRCQGFFYRLCGRHWPWFMRMHLYYFTTKTITEMLKESGFKVIRIRHYTHCVSLSYLFYKLMPLNRRLSGFLLNANLKPIILPVQLGDFMEVYAGKS